MGSDSIPKNSSGWEYKLRSSLCTHAFHRTVSKDPDIHVLDRWMPTTKTRTKEQQQHGCVHGEGRWGMEYKKNRSASIPVCAGVLALCTLTLGRFLWVDILFGYFLACLDFLWHVQYVWFACRSLEWVMAVRFWFSVGSLVGEHPGNTLMLPRDSCTFCYTEIEVVHSATLR